MLLRTLLPTPDVTELHGLAAERAWLSAWRAWCDAIDPDTEVMDMVSVLGAWPG